jgi:hypothetical protein
VRRLAAVLLLCACEAPPPAILSTTVPGDTRDVVGPYPVQVVVRDVSGDDSVEVRFSVDSATFVGLPTAERDGRDELRFAEIPGQPRGTRVYLFSTILRDGEVKVSDPAEDAGYYYSFTIAPLDACRADTDCAPGEICGGDPEGRCVAFAGTCVAGACPDGYLCDADDLCVIEVIACGSDDGCPSAQECDLERHECRPRRSCSSTMPCPDGQECRPDYGLCFR